LRIEIWDSGPGIPGDQRQNIFEEFYRLGDSAAEQGSGLGLGLAIVERLSKLLEHPLTLRSRLGQGSCFAVSVPKVAARAAVPATALAFADPLYGKFIVVIDDDELVLEAMQGILQTWGCRTVAAHSAESAMAMLRNADPPDLIMTDAELADRRTGLEAIESLRRKFGYPIPAFLISGDVSSDCLRAAANQGYQLLHKPVDPMTLRAIVTQLLKDREQPIHGNKSAIIVS
jgi:CheY-like chemotaxis protein